MEAHLGGLEAHIGALGGSSWSSGRANGALNQQELHRIVIDPTRSLDFVQCFLKYGYALKLVQ
jgi:hypothetical protein